MTADDILKDFLASVDPQINTDVGSFAYDLFYPLSRRVFELFRRVDELTDNAFALTAEGIYLDRISAEQGLSRHTATKSKGILTFTGERGAIIPIGSKAASDSVLFQTTENAVIPDNGSIDIPAECYVPGAAGNVSAGSINRFPIRIPGVSTVTNTAGFTGGYNTETDEALRNRYFNKVSNPRGSGTAADYKTWAMEAADGVGSVEVLECWNGAGTVKLIITDTNGEPASPELTEAVRAHIEDVRPLCAAVTVESASTVEITVSAVVSADNIDTARRQIEDAVKDYLKTCRGTVRYSHIGAAILGCSAVDDYSSLMVNNNTSNINIAAGYIPILKEVLI